MEAQTKPRPVPPEREAWYVVQSADICSVVCGVESRRCRFSILDKSYQVYQ